MANAQAKMAMELEGEARKPAEKMEEQLESVSNRRGC